MSFSIQWEHSGISLLFHGIVSAQDMERAHTMMFNDPRFDHVRSVLWDFSSVHDASLDHEEVKTMAYCDSVACSYKRQLRGAFVSTHEHLREHLENYIAHFANLGSNWSLRLFACGTEAKAWLQPVSAQG